MAASFRLLSSPSLWMQSRNLIRLCATCPQSSYKPRWYSQEAAPRSVDFAFAFDIDGVLLRGSKPLPRAHAALSLLHSRSIPYILLTNGGGRHESQRVAELRQKLGVPLGVEVFVQSHTPFAELEHYKQKTVLVVGGEGDSCRQIAERYGFKTVVTPGDLFMAHPEIWPFSEPFRPYYASFARPLPLPIFSSHASSIPSADSVTEHLKIDAIFVYNDPRDWGLDTSVIIDLLFSHSGIYGTLSHKNGDARLPNRGYLQDGQPALFFSNPDLWWASHYHIPRLGQGGFREALIGVWNAITGGKGDVEMYRDVIGKPFYTTYNFAEQRLLEHRNRLPGDGHGPLRRVYMVGDNPESDIRGANSYKSPAGTEWHSILVKTGVYRDGETPSVEPRVTVADVYDAVEWALMQSKTVAN